MVETQGRMSVEFKPDREAVPFGLSIVSLCVALGFEDVVGIVKQAMGPRTFRRNAPKFKHLKKLFEA